MVGSALLFRRSRDGVQPSRAASARQLATMIASFGRIAPKQLAE
jgi:hypothetical protein